VRRDRERSNVIRTGSKGLARVAALWVAAATVAVACGRPNVPADGAIAPRAMPSTASAVDTKGTPVASVAPAATHGSADGGVDDASVPHGTASRSPLIHGGGAHVVSGTRGVVTSVEDHATRAGIAILERGGNAIDAAVAVAYVLAVTHPSAGNLGGGGFLMYRPKGGPTVAIDFRESAPSRVTQKAFDAMIAARAVGPAAAGVPGSVAGLELAHSRFGRLSRRDVMAPAIELARRGFVLGRREARTIAWAWSDLAKDPEALAVFGAKGNPKKEGTLLVQSALADTLERIADGGADGFYRGKTATAIAALSKRGGLIGQDDLAAYAAKIREPLRTRYRGFSVELAPPPSAGGVAVAIMLGALEKRDAERFLAGSADALHLFAEVARRAHAIRRFDVVDPDSVPGYDLGAQEKSWLDVDRFLATPPLIDLHHATPSAAVNPLYAKAVQELEHTTHFSVADGDGNVVSCTTTLSAGFGSKAMAAGVVLNDSLAAFGTVGKNVLAPGRRMTTSMSPAIVLDGDTPVLLLGSPGGDTIPNTVTEVLRNVVDYGMTLDLAIDAPRIHQGFVPDEIRYEGARPPAKAVLAELERRGHHLSHKTLFIGDANDVLIKDGVAYAYADGREGGLALAMPSAAR
jgi:gamma-glutamyltranspeptidase/glutathione hydrolase